MGLLYILTSRWTQQALQFERRQPPGQDFLESARLDRGLFHAHTVLLCLAVTLCAMTGVHWDQWTGLICAAHLSYAYFPMHPSTLFCMEFVVFFTASVTICRDGGQMATLGIMGVQMCLTWIGLCHKRFWYGLDVRYL